MNLRGRGKARQNGEWYIKCPSQLELLDTPLQRGTGWNSSKLWLRNYATTRKSPVAKRTSVPVPVSSMQFAINSYDQRCFLARAFNSFRSQLTACTPGSRHGFFSFSTPPLHPLPKRNATPAEHNLNFLPISLERLDILIHEKMTARWPPRDWCPLIAKP